MAQLMLSCLAVCAYSIGPGDSCKLGRFILDDDQLKIAQQPEQADT